MSQRTRSLETFVRERTAWGGTSGGVLVVLRVGRRRESRGYFRRGAGRAGRAESAARDVGVGRPRSLPEGADWTPEESWAVSALGGQGPEGVYADTEA